jgi:hypothetical protein
MTVCGRSARAMRGLGQYIVAIYRHSTLLSSNELWMYEVLIACYSLRIPCISNKAPLAGKITEL